VSQVLKALEAVEKKKDKGNQKKKAVEFPPHTKKVRVLPPKEEKHLSRLKSLLIYKGDWMVWLLSGLFVVSLAFFLNGLQSFKPSQNGIDMPIPDAAVATVSVEAPSAIVHIAEEKIPEIVQTAIPEAPREVVITPALATLQKPVFVSESEMRYTIQLVTYRYESRAKREVEKLKQNGFSAFVMQRGKYFQVCVDRFRDREAARAKLDKIMTGGLEQTYHDAFVRVLTS